MDTIKTYITPLGIVEIGVNDHAITHLSIVSNQCLSGQETELHRQTINQLQAYITGDLSVFSAKLNPAGTDFQKEVWQALLEIPYGTTCSYSDIARKINKPKACRAVGQAIGKNPIGIIIPCHRVIGKDGSLTGFAGGLDLKKQLLAIEMIY